MRNLILTGLKMSVDSEAMKPIPECPTSAAIRAALIARADAFCRLTGMSAATLCRHALNRDGAFLYRVKAGENFTLGNYQRLNDYMDKQIALQAERARTFLKVASR